MNLDSRPSTAQLVADARIGDQNAVDKLLPLVYDELRVLADAYLARERPDHTLQPTALVNEAYLRLLHDREITWQDRAHFIGIAARSMRQILVKHAKAHCAAKRGGGRPTLVLDESWAADRDSNLDLLALDEALTSLAQLDSRLSDIVELRFFGGLTIQEAADVTGRSESTVERDWRAARAWLYQAMRQE